MLTPHFRKAAALLMVLEAERAKGETSQDDEAEIAVAINECRDQMSELEQSQFADLTEIIFPPDYTKWIDASPETLPSARPEE